MDKDRLEKQLQNSKIREGPLLKRSKFLKEWRQRWVVLTFNYLFTFTNKTCKEVTDIMDLKTLKSYKSYISKAEQMIPASFKIRSGDSSMYLTAKNTEEKWSWIVTIERLLDYRDSGASNYNNVSFIKSKGFPSLEEFTNPQLDLSEEMSNYKNLIKTAEKRKEQLEKQSIQIAKKMFKDQQQIQMEREQIKKERVRIEIIKEELEGIKSKNQISDSGQNRVDKLVSMYESKSFENNQIKKQVKQSKENVVNGIFDQFRSDSTEYFGFKYFIDFIIVVSSDYRLSYQTHIITAFKKHPNNKNFASAFIESITDYHPFMGNMSRISASFATSPVDLQYLNNLLKFINFILKSNIFSVFTENQLDILKNKLKDFLLGDEGESSEEIQILLDAMKRMHILKKYEKQQIEEKLIRIHKLSKKEVISKNAKELLNIL